MLLKFSFAALFAVRTQLKPGSVQRAMTHVVPVIPPCARLRGGLQHSAAAEVDVRVSLHQSQRMDPVSGAPMRGRGVPPPRSAAAVPWQTVRERQLRTRRRVPVPAGLILG